MGVACGIVIARTFEETYLASRSTLPIYQEMESVFFMCCQEICRSQINVVLDESFLMVILV